MINIYIESQIKNLVSDIVGDNDPELSQLLEYIAMKAYDVKKAYFSIYNGYDNSVDEYIGLLLNLVYENLTGDSIIDVLESDTVDQAIRILYYNLNLSFDIFNEQVNEFDNIRGFPDTIYNYQLLLYFNQFNNQELQVLISNYYSVL